MCRNCTVVYGVAAKSLVCSGNIFTSLFTVNKKVQDFTGFESYEQIILTYKYNRCRTVLPYLYSNRYNVFICKIFIQTNNYSPMCKKIVSIYLNYEASFTCYNTLAVNRICCL